MLKAYDYVENTVERGAIQTSESLNRELKLAKDAVERVLQMEIEGDFRCPGCGDVHPIPFFRKWEVEYLRCEVCDTVFTAIDDQTLHAYQINQALCEFRESEDYQREMTEKRTFSWQEILDWITFRSFRYLGQCRHLHIISGGDRHHGFSRLVQNSPLCATYGAMSEVEPTLSAQIALSLNLIQQSNRPTEHLRQINRRLCLGGLLFLSARIGTGFDILVLQEHAQIYPYEYVSLLSSQGLVNVLQKAGFSVLDYGTPGCMDVAYVQKKQAFIAREDHFIRRLIANSDKSTLGEFQRFLQKSGMSSYAHIVARKVEER